MAKPGPAEKLGLIILGLAGLSMVVPWWLITALVIAGVIYWYRSFMEEFTYWEKQGIAGPGQSQHFPFGMFFTVSEDPLNFDIDMNAKYGSVFGYHLFADRALNIADPELIRRVCVKDFSHFVNRMDENLVGKHSLMGKMFSVQRDERWRGIRNTLTPAFTSGKMKHMPHYIHQSLQRLDDVVNRYINKGENVPLKNTMSRFTLDTVAAISFALDIQAQTRDDNPFVVHARKLINIAFSDIGIYIQMLVPNLANCFTYVTGISVLKNDSEQFFRKSIRQIMDDRKEHPIARPDFLQLCLNSQKMTGDENIEHDAEIMFEDYKKAAKVHMTDDELIAQSALFLAAGFDTTASTLEFCLYLLTTHPEVQEKCRQEIREKCGTDPSKFTFDQIMHLDYVEATFSETLRKFPIAFRTMRWCNKEITYADYGLTIPKNTQVVFPIWPMHHDEKNFPEPEKFKPERFIGEDQQEINPYVYLPFGVGPRNSVGMRFAQLEMRQTIAHILTKYRLVPCEDTLTTTTDIDHPAPPRQRRHVVKEQEQKEESVDQYLMMETPDDDELDPRIHD